MSDTIKIPSVGSVERVKNSVNNVRDLYHGTPLERDTPQRGSRTKIRQAICKEIGVACTARAVGGKSKLFKIQFVRRKIVDEDTYTWVELQEEARCFNDSLEDIAVDTLIDVIRDADSKHYKMVIWVCET